MRMKEATPALQAGQIIGYAFSYFLFTTILTLVFHFLDKTPAGWTYLHFMAITGIIILASRIFWWLTR